MNLFPLLGGELLSRAGEVAQRRLGKAAYDIARTVHGARKPAMPEWLDLTQREQEKWIAAAGDVLDREIR
jgi:hypothetical protein